MREYSLKKPDATLTLGLTSVSTCRYYHRNIGTPKLPMATLADPNRFTT